MNVERNTEVRIQVTLGVTFVLTVKKVVVAHFVEILGSTFDSVYP